MKNFLKVFALLVCMSVSLPNNLQASSVVLSSAEKPAQLAYSPALTRAEVEAFMGRKMTFVERVGFKVNKKKFVSTTNKARAMAGDESTNGMAIAGFVCSLVFAPLGIIFSAIALGQIKESGQRGRGLAVAGLVIGIVFTALGLITLL